jgi:predicted transcriptional regulator YheO
MNEDLLDSLCRTAEAISIMFGKSCETVIHDFSQPDCPIVAIYNGHVSGREIGSTLSIYGDEISNYGKQELKRGLDYLNNHVVTRTGKQVKSTTVNFVGEGYHYALGINFECTALFAMENILKDLLQAETDLNQAMLADQSLEDRMDYCLSVVGKPIEKMNKADRVRVVALLKENNVFNLQRAIPYVAKRLQVSRFTIYHYLNEMKD